MRHKEELEIRSPVIILNAIVIYQYQKIQIQNRQAVRLIKVVEAIIVLEVLATQLRQQQQQQRRFPKKLDLQESQNGQKLKMPQQNTLTPF